MRTGSIRSSFAGTPSFAFVAWGAVSCVACSFHHRPSCEERPVDLTYEWRGKVSGFLGPSDPDSSDLPAQRLGSDYSGIYLSSGEHLYWLRNLDNVLLSHDAGEEFEWLGSRGTIRYESRTTGTGCTIGPDSAEVSNFVEVAIEGDAVIGRDSSGDPVAVIDENFERSVTFDLSIDPVSTGCQNPPPALNVSIEVLTDSNLVSVEYANCED